MDRDPSASLASARYFNLICHISDSGHIHVAVTIGRECVNTPYKYD